MLNWIAFADMVVCGLTSRLVWIAAAVRLVAVASTMAVGDARGAVPRGGERSVDHTASLQRRIDECFLSGGGTVEVEKGDYHVKALRLRSNVRLLLRSGARLHASRDSADFDGVVQNDSVEPFDGSLLDHANIIAYRSTNRWNNAVIRIYRAANVTIEGEDGSEIDGCNGYDPHGEEGFRGVHGISAFFSSNLVFRGYTVRDAGNWAHRIALCSDVVVEGLKIRGGHDGLDFHCCDRVQVRDCDIRSGDDCVAGFDNIDLTVRNCRLNSACSIFRIGGHNILCEDLDVFAPAEYCHRGSLKRDFMSELVDGITPKGHGRHSTLSFFTYYGNEIARRRPGKIVFRNCRIGAVDKLMHYNFSGNETWQRGTPLSDVTFENVVAVGLKGASTVYSTSDAPVKISMRGCRLDFAKGARAMFCGGNVGTLELERVGVSGIDGALFQSWSGAPEIRASEVEGVKPAVVKGEGAFHVRPI